jgi:hypothetical protein
MTTSQPTSSPFTLDQEFPFLDTTIVQSVTIPTRLQWEHSTGGFFVEAENALPGIDLAATFVTKEGKRIQGFAAKVFHFSRSPSATGGRSVNPASSKDSAPTRIAHTAIPRRSVFCPIKMAAAGSSSPRAGGLAGIGIRHPLAPLLDRTQSARPAVRCRHRGQGRGSAQRRRDQRHQIQLCHCRGNALRRGPRLEGPRTLGRSADLDRPGKQTCACSDSTGSGGV